ncbi:MAG: hypothetical protein HY721_06505 [Planctomycetes bacterium]|nr:hypothetical protein [Planctomycetota bacterium]
MEDALEDLLGAWEARFSKDLGPLHRRVKSLLESFTSPETVQSWAFGKEKPMDSRSAPVPLFAV